MNENVDTNVDLNKFFVRHWFHIAKYTNEAETKRKKLCPWFYDAIWVLPALFFDVR